MDRRGAAASARVRPPAGLLAGANGGDSPVHLTACPVGSAAARSLDGFYLPHSTVPFGHRYLWRRCHGGAVKGGSGGRAIVRG